MAGVREKGVVVSVDAEGATVRITPESGEHCAACGACGETGSGGTRMLRVREVEGLVPGAEVVVETAAVSHLSASLLLLLVPLLGLLVGAMLGRWLGPSLGLHVDLGPVLGGLLLLLLTYLGVTALDRRIRRRRGSLRPRILDPDRLEAP
jgi:sigma-E factor negative regulatory protein RseC